MSPTVWGKGTPYNSSQELGEMRLPSSGGSVSGTVLSLLCKPEVPESTNCCLVSLPPPVRTVSFSPEWLCCSVPDHPLSSTLRHFYPLVKLSGESCDVVVGLLHFSGAWRQRGELISLKPDLIEGSGQDLVKTLSSPKIAFLISQLALSFTSVWSGFSVFASVKRRGASRWPVRSL